jgi:GNAT superfamily N-acetyltransferase
MTRRNWAVREATAADAEQINRLFVETMQMTRAIDHDRWKFWENPFGDPYVMLASDGGRIVGQYALWPTPLRLGAIEIKGAQSLDTMTHPDYQGQGMFTVLANACFEVARSHGCEVLYGFPNGNSYHGFVKRLNWDHTGNVPLFSRILRPSRHPRIAPALGPVADFAASLIPTRSVGGVDVRPGRPSDDDIIRLLDAGRADRDVCRVSRTPTWYDWRFAERSGRRYEWFSVYRGGLLEGWSVWGRDILTDFPRGLLADVVATDHDVAVAAVGASISAARLAGVSVLVCATNERTTIRALRRCFFMRYNQIALIVRGLTTRTLPANIHDHGAWRVLPADLDTF